MGSEISCKAYEISGDEYVAKLNEPDFIDRLDFLVRDAREKNLDLYIIQTQKNSSDSHIAVLFAASGKPNGYLRIEVGPNLGIKSRCVVPLEFLPKDMVPGGENATKREITKLFENGEISYRRFPDLLDFSMN